MKTFTVKFTNGESRSVEAESFCPCPTGATFYIGGTPSAYYANVFSIEPVETLPELGPGEVLNTAGQPAATPPPGGWPEVEPAKTADQNPPAENVGSPS